MSDLYHFLELMDLVDPDEVSWGWNAFLFYASLFIVFASLAFFQSIIGCTIILFRFKKIPAEDTFRVLRSNSLPPITFIVPAYNEERDILHTAKNMLSLSYRYKKVIIINDGSTDNTLNILKEHYNLKPVPPSFNQSLETAPIKAFYASEEYPELLVIDKDNSGKADSLNVGINVCEDQILVAADADTLVDDEALNRLVRPFLVNPYTVAAHASIGNVNGCKIAENRVAEYNFPKKLLLGYQVLDFMKGFLVDRLGLKWTKGALVIPGNFGMFKLDTLIEIGGYDRYSIIEDTEIVTRLHKYMMDEQRKYEITYISDIVAWTEAPETIKTLGHQRLRWYKGTTQNIWQYRGMWFNPKYRTIGLYVCPMTVLEKIAPLIEISGFLILGYAAFQGTVELSLVFILAFMSWGFLMYLVLLSMLVEFIAYETYTKWIDYVRMLKCVLLYTLYHYLLMYWRIKGLYAPKPTRIGWDPVREGYDKIQNQ